MNSKAILPHTIQPLAVKTKQACILSGLGKTSIYAAIRRGELQAIKRGKTTLIMVDELKRWLNAGPKIGADHTNPPN